MSDRKRPLADLARNINMGEPMAVAAVVGLGLATLYALNRGFRGIGDFQLTGSTVRGIEWAANAMVVGGTLRVLQANFPENRFVQALAFVY